MLVTLPNHTFMTFSPELHVMTAPRRAYAEALAAPESGRWVAVRRPLLVALVLGAGSAFASTGHLTLGLLSTAVVCWSFVALIQVATGAAVMWPTPRTAVPFARRLDLWFMGHGPWSLWILTAATVMGTAPVTWQVEWPVILTALVAIIWTSIIAAAFVILIIQ